MNKGMLIDIDHMSNNSLKETIELAAARHRRQRRSLPAAGQSRASLRICRQEEFTGNRGRHERMRTRAQLNAIRASGGMVATMLKDDVQDTDLKGQKFNTRPTRRSSGRPLLTRAVIPAAPGRRPSNTPWT